MAKWYCRGEMGEYVLSIIESWINDNLSTDAVIDKLREIGMEDQDIMDVVYEEVTSSYA